MKTFPKVLSALTAVLWLGFAVSAGAQDDPNTMAGKAGWGSCGNDVQKFCADVKPGEGRIMECLAQHESDLSQKCATHRANLRAKWETKRKELRQACQSDIDKFCEGVEPGPGIGQCLHQHMNDLSDTCQAETQKLKKRMQERGTASKTQSSDEQEQE